jgi:hypothetical protein
MQPAQCSFQIGSSTEASILGGMALGTPKAMLTRNRMNLLGRGPGYAIALPS